MDRTLVFIKPEHVDIADIVLDELDEIGRRLITKKIINVPEDTIKRHYQPLEDRYYYNWLVDSLKNKTIVLAIYEGDDIVKKISEKVGPTDPATAPEDTIRGKYSDDSLETAKKERRGPANVIHRSDSDEEAIREINVWSAYLGLET
jgi:nucleoside-diphosphate kinase